MSSWDPAQVSFTLPQLELPQPLCTLHSARSTNAYCHMCVGVHDHLKTLSSETLNLKPAVSVTLASEPRRPSYVPSRHRVTDVCCLPWLLCRCFGPTRRTPPPPCTASTVNLCSHLWTGLSTGTLLLLNTFYWGFLFPGSTTIMT